MDADTQSLRRKASDGDAKAQEAYARAQEREGQSPAMARPEMVVELCGLLDGLSPPKAVLRAREIVNLAYGASTEELEAMVAEEATGVRRRGYFEAAREAMAAWPRTTFNREGEVVPSPERLSDEDMATRTAEWEQVQEDIRASLGRDEPGSPNIGHGVVVPLGGKANDAVREHMRRLLDE